MFAPQARNFALLARARVVRCDVPEVKVGVKGKGQGNCAWYGVHVTNATQLLYAADGALKSKESYSYSTTKKIEVLSGFF